MRSPRIFYASSLALILGLALLCQPAVFNEFAAARDYQPVESLGHPKGDSGLRKPVMPLSKNRSAPANPARAGQSRVKASAAASSSKFVSSRGDVMLFGTVDFGRPLSTLPGWLDVISRNEANPIFQDQKYFNKTTNWGQLKAKLKGLGLTDQLREVNKFWNTWAYREDRANWGQEDYWEIPAEFLKNSGDCEDYAIVKYFTLKELGVDPKKMRIVVLRDTVRNLAHAVLAVYTDGDALVLDNLSNVVLSHKRLANYDPQYSVNEFGRWTHIRGKLKKK